MEELQAPIATGQYHCYSPSARYSTVQRSIALYQGEEESNVSHEVRAVRETPDAERVTDMCICTCTRTPQAHGNPVCQSVCKWDLISLSCE